MKNILHTKGFTLIETLIAIAILTLSIFGAFSAVQSGLSASVYSKEEITAYYLAQEAVEQVRNVRDANALSPNIPAPGWLDNIATGSNQPCAFDTYCMVDAANNQLAPCPDSNNPDSCVVHQNAISGFYNEVLTDPASIYRRSVKLHQISANEVDMQVTVAWTKGTLSPTFIIHEDLLNWQ